MRITEVTSRRDLRRFIGLPFRLYRGHALWVPPVLLEQRAMLSRRRNPFFAHSEAALFLAEQDGEVVGRVVVMEHRPYNTHTGRSDALFDMFECEDDPVVAARLIGAAESWARERGLTALTGPRRFLAGATAGVLVDGFEHPPALSVPYNHPYYDALLMGTGLVKQTDMLSAYVDRTLEAPEGMEELAESLIAGHGLTRFSYPSRWALWRDRMTFVGLINDTFADSDDFIPLNEAEMRLMARGFAAIADPEIIFYIKKGDEIVALMSMLPDVSAAIRRTRGKVFPFGWARLLREARRTRLLNVHLFGVLPEWRGIGMNVVAYSFVANRAQSSRYETAEAVLVDESNHKMVRNLGMVDGITWSKRHRIYEKQLPA